MSESLRDERVKLYAYSSADTDGYPASTYTYARTYWGRKAVPGSREATIAAQASQRVDAVFVLPEGAWSKDVGGVKSIDADGAIRGQDGILMKIVGVEPVRNTSSFVEQIVTAVYSDEQELTTVES